jgi:hypothetical protein
VATATIEEKALYTGFGRIWLMNVARVPKVFKQQKLFLMVRTVIFNTDPLIVPFLEVGLWHFITASLALSFH